MLNSNKRSVVLDLKTDAGRQALLDLVETADVLIENFAPGTMERLQLGPARLLEHNPRLIVASGKGYGSTGPYAHMSAMDITVQAMSGGAATTGEPDGPPTKAGAAFVDFSGGIHLFGAISAALFQRERTGRGQIVEVSMHDTIYPMLASSLGGLHNDPEPRAPRAHREPPLGHGHRAVQHLRGERRMAGDHLHLRAALARGGHRPSGRPELIDDPRFRERADRVANIDAVDEAVSSCTRTRTRAELVRDLQAAGVPCAPVKSIREVDTDEHLIERGMIRYVEHPARGRVPVPGCPLRLSDSPVGTAAARGAAGPVDRRGPRRAASPERSTDMSFTPEPGTPLATYYAETQPRVGAVLSRRSLGLARRGDHRALRDDHRGHRPGPPRRGGGAVGWLRRCRRPAQPAGRDRGMGHRHPRSRPPARRNSQRR